LSNDKHRVEDDDTPPEPSESKYFPIFDEAFEQYLRAMIADVNPTGDPHNCVACAANVAGALRAGDRQAGRAPEGNSDFLLGMHCCGPIVTNVNLLDGDPKWQVGDAVGVPVRPVPHVTIKEECPTGARGVREHVEHWKGHPFRKCKPENVAELIAKETARQSQPLHGIVVHQLADGRFQLHVTNFASLFTNKGAVVRFMDAQRGIGAIDTKPVAGSPTLGKAVFFLVLGVASYDPQSLTAAPMPRAVH
jgi:hypothetical protein